MGVSLKHAGYSCWRCGHKGGRPHQLIQELLHCSFAEAAAIVGDDGIELPSDMGFLGQLQGLFQGATALAKPKASLTLPATFRRLYDDARGLGKLFVDYLGTRGYTRQDLPGLLETFPLYYCTRGSFSYRLVFPIYCPRDLSSWTGRAITKAVLRYKTLSTDPEKAAAEDMPVALAPTTHLLWNYPNLQLGGEKLFLVEGPLDALNVSFHGLDYGIKATCLFTKIVSEQQLDLLADINHLYKEKYLLLDAEVDVETVALMNKLGTLGFKRATLPQRVSDPAELTAQQVREIRAERYSAD